jgi:7,8-dihydroneopterin aldolase/epimerase/oxygenase
MNMDRIFIERLSLKGKHGVHDREREVEQEFLFDIAVECDTQKAGSTDHLADTLDYVRFRDIAREVVEENSFYLIEKLAETVAQKILEDVRVLTVSVTIRKPAALESGVPGVVVIRTRP